MLKPGENSYVSMQEAAEYVKAHYLGRDSARKSWDGLSPEDQTTRLISACADIETLPFTGRKSNAAQALAFPRLPAQYGKAQDIPQKVKDAQVELAMWMADDKKSADRAQRKDLQEQGVKSFSVGNLSESYGDGGFGIKSVALACSKSAALLRPYLGGGYRVC